MWETTYSLQQPVKRWTSGERVGEGGAGCCMCQQAAQSDAAGSCPFSEFLIYVIDAKIYDRHCAKSPRLNSISDGLL